MIICQKKVLALTIKAISKCLPQLSSLSDGNGTNGDLPFVERYIVWCHYNGVNFLKKNIHKSHLISLVQNQIW